MRACLLLLALTALAAPAAATPWDGFWCADADEIIVARHGDGLMVTHLAALYNCCPGPMVYDVAMDGTAVVLTETALEATPCDCDCCFETITVLVDLPGAATELRFRWFDFESAGWAELTAPLPQPVPGDGDGPPAVDAQALSACLTDTGITAPPTVDWSTLKQSYR